MTWRRASIHIALMLAASACTRIPPQPLDPEITFQKIESNTLDSPELKTYIESQLGRLEPWPLHRWDFPHLELVAWYYHPQLEIARAQLQLADADIKTAKMRPNPILNFWPAHDTNVAPNTPPWTIIATLQFYVTDFLYRRHQIQEAENKYLAAGVSYAQTAWTLSNTLKQNLTNIIYAKKSISLIEEHLELTKQLLKLTEGSLANGDITKFELRALEISKLQLEIQLESARQQMQSDRIALAGSLGLTVNALQGIQFDFPFQERPLENCDFKALRRLALTHRADILEALYNYAASQSALEVELARQVPNIQLGPGYDYDQGVSEWGINLTLPLPLFNLNEGPIAQALARRELSAATFLSLQSRILAEIDQAMAAYQSSLKKQDEALNFLQKSQKNEQDSKKLFESGDISRFDLVNAEIQMNAARTEYLNAAMTLQTALISLEGVLQYPILNPESSCE